MTAMIAVFNFQFFKIFKIIQFVRDGDGSDPLGLAGIST